MWVCFQPDYGSLGFRLPLSTITRLQVVDSLDWIITMFHQLRATLNSPNERRRKEASKVDTGTDYFVAKSRRRHPTANFEFPSFSFTLSTFHVVYSKMTNWKKIIFEYACPSIGIFISTALYSAPVKVSTVLHVFYLQLFEEIESRKRERTECESLPLVHRMYDYLHTVFEIESIYIDL